MGCGAVRRARVHRFFRGCDRLAHISHSPHQVDHLHILVSRLLLRVSTTRVTDPTYSLSQVVFGKSERQMLMGAQRFGTSKILLSKKAHFFYRFLK